MAIRPQCTRIATTYNKEKSYGAGVATDLANADKNVPIANIDKRFDLREPVSLAPGLEKVDDADRLKGHEFPSDATNKDIIVSRTMQIPFSFDASLELLGMILSNAMGVDVASAVGMVNVGVTPTNYYDHVLKVGDICAIDQYPSAVWISGHEGTSESYLLLKGVIVNDVRVALDGKGWIPVTGTAYSDGTSPVVSSVFGGGAWAFPSVEHPVDYITGVQADFLTANKGVGVVTKKAKLRGLEFAINNNLDVDDAQGNIIQAGIYLGSLRTGARAYTLSVTVEGHQGDEFWQDYVADQEKVVQLTITKNAARAITLDFPSVTLANVTPGFDGIRSTLQFDYKMFYDNVLKSPISITIRNGDPQYLVPVA